MAAFNCTFSTTQKPQQCSIILVRTYNSIWTLNYTSCKMNTSHFSCIFMNGCLCIIILGSLITYLGLLAPRKISAEGWKRRRSAARRRSLKFSTSALFRNNNENQGWEMQCCLGPFSVTLRKALENKLLSHFALYVKNSILLKIKYQSCYKKMFRF